MGRSLGTFVLVYALSSSGVASAQGRDLVRVHVRLAPQAGGFVEPGAEDSVKDMTNALKGKQILRLVPTPEEADVILEVASRGKEFRGETLSTVNKNLYTGEPMGVSTNPQKSHVVYARLIAGNYSKDLEGVAGLWSKAAKNIAKQTEEWIKANEARLRNARG